MQLETMLIFNRPELWLQMEIIIEGSGRFPTWWILPTQFPFVYQACVATEQGTIGYPDVDWVLTLDTGGREGPTPPVTINFAPGILRLEKK